MDNKFNTIELLKEFEADPINQTLSEKYLSPTFLDIIGKSRSETVHTNFLKWLIHQKEWNKEFISRFLYALNEKSKEQGLKSFILEDEDVTISEIKASTEAKCVLKVNNKINKSYVDLIITCNLNEIPVKIIIENKIDAPEHDNQTWKYYTYFSNNDLYTKAKGIEVYQKKYNYKSEKNELKIFVYLAPEWNNESISELGICEHFIRFTYQDLYDSALSFLRSLPKTERISFIFREYLEILFQPYVDKNNRLKTLVMEKQNTDNSKILRAFLKKNLPLFMLAVETVKNDTLEPDEI